MPRPPPPPTPQSRSTGPGAGGETNPRARTPPPTAPPPDFPPPPPCGDDGAVESTRLDKWLWAARLVKTRGLAVEAISGGRVHVNDARVKPSKEVRIGDRLDVTIAQIRREVIVRGIADRRGPAREAALLYEETAESRERRERLAADRRLSPPPVGPRPTKRDRRRLDSARSRGSR